MKDIDAPRIYLESAGCTIQWLSDRSFNTVIEYNRWLGPVDLPERCRELELTRHVVLMECDHNAILKINEEMHKGTVAVAECLEICRDLDGVLGWDFQRREPRILVYPCSSSRRALTPLPEESRG